MWGVIERLCLVSDCVNILGWWLGEIFLVVGILIKFVGEVSWVNINWGSVSSIGSSCCKIY